MIKNLSLYETDSSLKTLMESYLHELNGHKVLLITTSTRWSGSNEIAKSTKFALWLHEQLKDSRFVDATKKKIYECEGNVSRADGNKCGTKDSLLKDNIKNPHGQLRCWASLNHPDDELWTITKDLMWCDYLVFFGSVRWGSPNSVYQKLIERLTWIENRHTTLKEENIIKNKQVGLFFFGHNYHTKEFIDNQYKILSYFGFKTNPKMFNGWSFTKPDDESATSYVEAYEIVTNTIESL